MIQWATEELERHITLFEGTEGTEDKHAVIGCPSLLMSPAGAQAVDPCLPSKHFSKHSSKHSPNDAKGSKGL
jgi:hypothetical protein